jgi:cytochrome c-type biogenesis protein CcmH/NrfF
MENLLWILPLLICPLGMLLMGAVVWVAARLGRRSPEPGEGSPAERGMHSPPILPEQRPNGLERA